MKCNYCGKEISVEERDRNYDFGLAVAEANSYASLGHINRVVAYSICDKCTAELKDD